MPRITIISVGILSLMMAAISAQNLQQPSPTPSKHTQQKQRGNAEKQTEADHNNNETTTTLPTEVIAPTYVLEPEAQNRADNKQDYASPEWGLVYVTGFLALVTVVLASYTACLWRATKTMARDAHRTGIRQAVQTRRSLAIAKESADTAKRQADDFRAMQSAQLVEEQFDPEITNIGADFLIRGAFLVKNIGHTAATHVFVQYQSGFGHGLPDYPKMELMTTQEGPSIAPGDLQETPIGWQVPHWQTTDGRHYHALFMVSYRDIFERPKILQVCYVYEPRRNKFFIHAVKRG